MNNISHRHNSFLFHNFVFLLLSIFVAIVIPYQKTKGKYSLLISQKNQVKISPKRLKSCRRDRDWN